MPGHHSHEQVTAKSDGLHVRVSFDRVAAGTLEDFGRSWFVGWEGDARRTPAHLRWTLESVKVNRSLDPNPDRPQQSGVPPGEYNLYVDLNGYWNFVGGRGPTGGVTGGYPPEWVPGLGAVQNGQMFANINRSVDFFVAPGKPVRLFVDARECDLPHMDPCAATTELSDGNDAPGDHADTFATPAASLGRHVLKPAGDAYEMTYSIARLPGVGRGPTPPGGTGIPGSSPPPPPRGHCTDTHAPESHFARHGAVDVSSHGLELRGGASDRGCGVDRVSLAVGRHLGDHRCQYMRPNGKLRPVSKCSQPEWVRATGARHWKLTTDRALPEGTYTAHVRAVDRAGNFELFTRTDRNFRKFRTR
jgi:hypothetical protein